MSVRTCSFRPLAGVNYNPREEPEAREAAHAGFRPLAGVNYNKKEPSSSSTHCSPCFRPLAGVNYNRKVSYVLQHLEQWSFPSPCGGEL